MLRNLIIHHNSYPKIWLNKRYSQQNKVTDSVHKEKNEANIFNAGNTNFNIDEFVMKNHEQVNYKLLDEEFEDWHKPTGKMKILHAINKLRIPFIRDGLLSSCKQEFYNSSEPLVGFEILDVGRGAGLLSEPLAKMGASVTGIGKNANFIMLARQQARKDPSLSQEDVFYVNTSIEKHAQKETDKYDAVIATEIVEHEQNKQKFLKWCWQALKPGGSIFITTLNRTTNAWIGGLAQPDSPLDNMEKYRMGNYLEPITPAEMSVLLKDAGYEPMAEQGMLYLLLNNTWYWTSRKSTSYAMQAIKQ